MWERVPKAVAPSGVRPWAREVRRQQIYTNKTFRGAYRILFSWGKTAGRSLKNPSLTIAVGREWPWHYNVGYLTALQSSITMDTDCNAVVHCNGFYKDGCLDWIKDQKHPDIVPEHEETMKKWLRIQSTLPSGEDVCHPLRVLYTPRDPCLPSGRIEIRVQGILENGNIHPSGQWIKYVDSGLIIRPY